ncbi:MAG: hypothetical protein ACK4OP_00340, partial [Gemmobacter sp.]
DTAAFHAAVKAILPELICLGPLPDRKRLFFALWRGFDPATRAAFLHAVADGRVAVRIGGAA